MRGGKNVFQPLWAWICTKEKWQEIKPWSKYLPVDQEQAHAPHWFAWWGPFLWQEQIQLHVLSFGVKNRIMSQGDSTGIVTKNDRSGVRNLKFRKKGLNSSDLSCYESHAPIFCLCTRTGNRWLFLGLPRDWIRSKKNSSSRCRPPIIQIRCPICIAISMKRKELLQGISLEM